MKLFVKILSFLMVLVLFTSEDCSNSSVEVSKQDRISGIYQEIEGDFLDAELSQEVLSAFEEKAIQKLHDIFDYINIYADSGFSEPFRKQASDLIQQSFHKSDELQNFYKGLELTEDSVNHILLCSGILFSLKISLGTIKISNQLVMTSNTSYAGEIQFTLEMIIPDTNETVILNTYQGQIKMLALKTKMNFGTKSEDVWKVYLGKTEFKSNV